MINKKRVTRVRFVSGSFRRLAACRRARLAPSHPLRKPVPSHCCSPLLLAAVGVRDTVGNPWMRLRGIYVAPKYWAIVVAIMALKASRKRRVELDCSSELRKNKRRSLSKPPTFAPPSRPTFIPPPAPPVITLWQTLDGEAGEDLRCRRRVHAPLVAGTSRASDCGSSGARCDADGNVFSFVFAVFARKGVCRQSRWLVSG